MPIRDFDVRAFRTFGFVVLRGMLTETECRSLAREFLDAFQAAFPDLRTRTAPAWLPGLADATPLSAVLTADDPRLWTLSRQLLGCDSLPCPPEVAFLRGLTQWHFDDPLGIRGVKFLVYLNGAAAGLRLLPLSHAPAQRALVAEHVAAAVNGGSPLDALDLVPAAPVATEPGDVVAIDLHVWHCYQVGEPRILWSPEYLALPAAPELLEQKFAAVATAGAAEDGRGEWPVWRDWLRADPLPDRRRLAIEALRNAGAFHADRELS